MFLVRPTFCRRDFLRWCKELRALCEEPDIIYEGPLETSITADSHTTMIINILSQSKPNKPVSLQLRRDIWKTYSARLRKIFIEKPMSKLRLFEYLSIPDLQTVFEMIGGCELDELEMKLKWFNEEEYVEVLKFLMNVLEMNLRTLKIAFFSRPFYFIPLLETFLNLIQLKTSIRSLTLSHFFVNIEADLFFSKLPYTSLQELTLKNSYLNYSDLSELFKNLPTSNIQKLDLCSNSICDKGINLLSEALKGSKITHLYLRHNTFEGENDFAKTLSCTSLMVLDLSHNSFRYGKMFNFPSFLENSSIIELKLNHINTTADIWAQLIMSLKNSRVKKLDLNRNDLRSFDATLLKNILLDTQIVDLDLNFVNLSAEMLKDFAEFLQKSHIKRLHLGYPTYDKSVPYQHLPPGHRNSSDEDGKVILQLRRILECCKNSRIEDLKIAIHRESWLPPLADDWLVRDHQFLLSELKFSSLTHLRIEGVRPSTRTIELIGESLQDSKLMALSLSHNEMGDEGAKTLAKFLKTSPLILLDLSFNKIKVKGSVALSEQIENTFLLHLNLNHNAGAKVDLLNAVCLKNRLTAHKFKKLYETLAPRDGEMNWRFDEYLESCGPQNFLRQSLLFYKAYYDNKAAINVLLGEESDINAFITKSLISISL